MFIIPAFSLANMINNYDRNKLLMSSKHRVIAFILAPLDVSINLFNKQRMKYLGNIYLNINTRSI